MAESHLFPEMPAQTGACRSHAHISGDALLRAYSDKSPVRPLLCGFYPSKKERHHFLRILLQGIASV